MRYGIISDVHGNLEALKVSLAALDSQGIDQLICLGDVGGYGAQPNECCDIVRESASLSVLGNHDAMVIGKLSEKHCHAAAARGVRYAAGQLSEENANWLGTLDYKVEEGNICFCHGSPINAESFDYLFSLDKAAALTAQFDELSDVTFVGHSHLTTAFLVTERISLQVSAPRFQLRPGVKYVFNVGSVGQPRDHDQRCCCVIYDTDERTVTYLRNNYDVEAAASKIFAADLPPAFGQRLYHGV